MSSTDPAETVERSTTSAESQPRPTGGVSHAWRALRHRNFRLFFGGQTISLIGTWMTRVATGWLVYRLTGSALLLGTVSFAGQIPTFLVAPLAGVWVDRFDRRQVLIWTQTLSMVQSLALAALTLSGHITISRLLALSVMQGVINAFDMPGRQSFMVKMVDDKRDLQNAIAINSSMVNLARLIGPSLAGMLIAVSSEGWCFLVDGISYIAVIASLLAMRLHEPVVKRAAASTLSELKAGWAYVSNFLPIRTILLLFAVVSLMGMPFVVLMPIFAKDVLHGGPHTLGFLMGSMGLGALDLGALAGGAQKCARPGQDDPHRRGRLRHGADRFRALARLLALDDHGLHRGHGHDAGHGRQQHRHSDHRHRRQARPRDELLYDGLHGHGALRQLACRHHGAKCWRALDGDFERRRRSCWARRGSSRACRRCGARFDQSIKRWASFPPRRESSNERRTASFHAWAASASTEQILAAFQA